MSSDKSFLNLHFSGQEITKVMNSKNDKETPQITSPVSTVAEVAADQLHANEKLIAGKWVAVQIFLTLCDVFLTHDA